MKILNLVQGSDDWRAWRKTVITATDCPAILGSSPWVTEYLCWQRKLDLIEEQKTNTAMERGVFLEPAARAQFIERYRIEMVPAVVESEEYDFLGASLDGISQDGKSILEIKCGGTKLHTMAEQGCIPGYYLDQIQHQLLVTRAERCYYYSFDGETGIRIDVYPDPAFEERFMPKANAFWKNIAFREPPAMRKEDYRDRTDEDEWKKLVKIYKDLDREGKAIDEMKAETRKKLIEICDNQSCSGNGIKVVKTTTKGSISYDEIEVLKEINLEVYRKPATTVWKVLIEK